ncbi:MAG TPA: hypothetical protein VN903_16915 [Polyangia bacterium]|jgi:hypothetical protein|nr:hypothetical protein [Polyangia bacterium]
MKRGVAIVCVLGAGVAGLFGGCGSSMKGGMDAAAGNQAGAGGSAGTGGAAGNAGENGGAGRGGASGGGTTGSGGGGGTIACGCSSGMTCCADGTCVDFDNDARNCGGCGVKCTALLPACIRGICRRQSSCEANIFCMAQTPRCCGSGCCGSTQLCCYLGAATNPTCVTPTAANPSCPSN